jgi:hypothetical protein
MAARIFRHAETEDVADELEHPIPALGVIDVNTIKRGGGADLHIVIAKPIQDDAHSQNRLLSKIEGYLNYIRSNEFLAEAGPPDPSNTQVLVQIHPESNLVIFELLERCKPWALENRATLVVRLLDQSIQ